MTLLTSLVRSLFGGSVFAPRKHIHIYNQLVWWSFLVCTLLFLRAFFGLGSFDDLALDESSLDALRRNANTGEIPGAFSHTSPKRMPSRERISSQNLVDSSAAQFVADVTAKITAITEEEGDASSQEHRASKGEDLEPHSESPSPLLEGDQAEGLGESALKLASSLLDASDDEDLFTTHFTSGDVDYTIDITTPESRSDLGYQSSQPEPFLSLEEFDKDGANFALKIWLDSSYPLAVSVTLGEDEICEGSRGIKCLPEE